MILYNYAVWGWSRFQKRWLLRGRFPTLAEAETRAGEKDIVIDVVTDQMVWWRGTSVSRAKPYAVPTLPVDKGPSVTVDKGQSKI